MAVESPLDHCPDSQDQEAVDESQQAYYPEPGLMAFVSVLCEAVTSHDAGVRGDPAE